MIAELAAIFALPNHRINARGQERRIWLVWTTQLGEAAKVLCNSRECELVLCAALDRATLAEALNLVEAWEHQTGKAKREATVLAKGRLRKSTRGCQRGQTCQSKPVIDVPQYATASGVAGS
jgi:hypothetical protein